VATFETRLRDQSEVAVWLGEGRPLLVAQRDGRVVGFARVAPYSARPAYATVGEHAVHVAREARGSGLGTRLLVGLVHAAEQAGVHKLTSRVFAENAASRAIHRATGFEEVGVQRRTPVSTDSGATSCSSSG
jgi:L-amino acid N-acyltransferase YncA